VGYGKRFETHYYPDETHLFTHRVTWRDALTKVEAALKQFLDYTPEAEALEAAAALSAAVGPAGRGGRPRAG
jgi:hypothetical protein